ncbi:TlpA family protein disulfide reductase [Daeguia caeni]|uniref:TlpA family protein disulfide reductase n=1 Tax=Daeguia caeni TaxID=439612 RepID=A0ABV9H3G1_9HYPH
MKQNFPSRAFLAIALVLAPIFSGFIPASAYAQAQHATLVQYDADTDLKALAAKGNTVLFFFATWCPNCILTLTELQEKWSEIDPSVTLVIADYDQETALKAQYGVTYQDTFVLLDRQARGVKLWNAGGIAGLNANVRAQ